MTVILRQQGMVLKSLARELRAPALRRGRRKRRQIHAVAGNAALGLVALNVSDAQLSQQLRCFRNASRFRIRAKAVTQRLLHRGFHGGRADRRCGWARLEFNAGFGGQPHGLRGDRRAGDFESLRGKTWDAVIDNSATNPDWVRDSAQLLKAGADVNAIEPTFGAVPLHKAVYNGPAVQGKVYVLVDVSGSMSSPITGQRKGATSAMRCIDGAALVAAERSRPVAPAARRSPVCAPRAAAAECSQACPAAPSRGASSCPAAQAFHSESPP